MSVKYCWFISGPNSSRIVLQVIRSGNDSPGGPQEGHGLILPHSCSPPCNWNAVQLFISLSLQLAHRLSRDPKTSIAMEVFFIMLDLLLNNFSTAISIFWLRLYEKFSTYTPYMLQIFRFVSLKI